jgi:hypothetical protein
MYLALRIPVYYLIIIRLQGWADQSCMSAQTLMSTYKNSLTIHCFKTKKNIRQTRSSFYAVLFLRQTL